MRPRFRPRFDVQTVSPDLVVLVAEESHTALHGPLYGALAGVLDGTRTEDEIVDALADRFPAERVYYALHRLRQRSLLAAAEADVLEGEAAFWDHLEASAGAAARARNASVSLHAVGHAPAHATGQALEAAGLRPAEDADFHLVVTPDALHPDLRAWNRARLADGRAWMLLRPAGAALWVGPIFEPGRTACWECMAHRLRGHREVEMSVGHLAPARARVPASEHAAAGLAALEILRYLGTGQAAALGALVTYEVAGAVSQWHEVTRLPYCPACGDPRPREARIPSFASLEPVGPSLRTAPASVTCARLERHVGPLVGVVQTLQRLDTGSDDLHVYGSGVNFAVPGRNLEDLRMGLRSQCSGKGRTDLAARASALAEAVERHSGVFHGDEPRLLGRLEDFGGDAVHPHDFLAFSERQYAEREVRNADGFHWIPRPFDPEREVEWTPLWSLTQGRWRWLPTSLCYYRYFLEDPFGFADSNGCAAGNTPEEAVVQGFLELVERDAVAIWWYNRLARPRVDLEGLDLAAWGDRRVWAVDLTTDLGIPCVAALSAAPDGRGLLMGFGAHFDARQAVLRAVTEMAQSLPHYRNWQAGHASFTPELAEWWAKADLAGHVWMEGEGQTRLSGAMPAGSLGGLVDHCRAVAAGAGMDLLVLDQTRPEIGFPVVKVVVPGLRHFWSRLGPGRLYEVPVRMGWRPAPLDEAELNPEAILL